MGPLLRGASQRLQGLSPWGSLFATVSVQTRVTRLCFPALLSSPQPRGAVCSPASSALTSRMLVVPGTGVGSRRSPRLCLCVRSSRTFSLHPPATKGSPGRSSGKSPPCVWAVAAAPLIPSRQRQTQHPVKRVCAVGRCPGLLDPGAFAVLSVAE